IYKIIVLYPQEATLGEGFQTIPGRSLQEKTIQNTRKRPCVTKYEGSVFAPSVYIRTLHSVYHKINITLYRAYGCKHLFSLIQHRLPVFTHFRPYFSV